MAKKAVILAIALAVILSGCSIPGLEKECKTAECMTDALLECKAASYTLSLGYPVYPAFPILGANIYYADQNATFQIEGRKGEQCKIILTNIKTPSNQAPHREYCYLTKTKGGWILGQCQE